ncbi:MAG: 50S ribosomal protein L27 [Candidatus Yanofskybacteria bacterium]|nr:50S ribosomal protein L27 [Candidatus Yanofskybacteria bacterium]
MSTTKAAGTSRNARDSEPKYLGVKLFAGQRAKVGQVLIRQRGTQFAAGSNVKEGGDNTLFALRDGVVRFSTKRKRNFNNRQRILKIIHVDPVSRVA